MATHAPAESQRMTADDLLAMGDAAKLYELVEGMLVERAMSSIRSSAIAIRVAIALGNYVFQHDLGLVGGADGAYILKQDPQTVRIPDVSFVRADRVPPLHDQFQFLALAPDLVVEVVSPSDRSNEVMEKVREYLDAGVRLIWVVHPEQRMVTVFTPDHVARLLYEEDTLEGGDVLPGFAIPVADLFV